MPDVLAEALALPGFGWLALTALIAGIVRGFAGFGTAMIYMPVAAQILPPFSALASMALMDSLGPLPNAPRAWRDGHRGDILRLSAGAFLALPLGLLLLSYLPVEAFRTGVSAIALALLILLIAGVRYHGVLRRWMVFGTGGIGGLLSGSTGLAGPPVIMLYMASTLPSRVVRANLLLYLLIIDILLVPVMWIGGKLESSAVVIGLVLTVPYMAGNVFGARIYRPEYERSYRWAAYAIIAVSAIQGLPLFD